MPPFRVEAPADVLLPIADLREAVRAETDEQDTLIENAGKAAVVRLDGFTGRLGRCILDQKWALPLAAGQDIVDLPFPDCREFQVEALEGGTWSNVGGVAIQYFDCQVSLTDVPEDGTGLHLTFRCGWESAEDVPEDIKQAVRMLVAHLYRFDPKSWEGLAAGRFPANVETMISGYVSVFG